MHVDGVLPTYLTKQWVQSGATVFKCFLAELEISKQNVRVGLFILKTAGVRINKELL